MNLTIDKEWFERRAKAEADLEIGAGFSVVNMTDADIAQMEVLAERALPQWAQDELARLRAIVVARNVECSVMPMKTSSGTDYYVYLRCGDRDITPHMFKEAWKAEYEVAEWKWLLGQDDKPDILAYGPSAPSASEDTTHA